MDENDNSVNSSTVFKRWSCVKFYSDRIDEKYLTIVSTHTGINSLF